MPRVSVVIPVFNAAPYLGAALRSIVEQPYADLEVVVVDDGSTDGSGEVARGFGDRVRVVRQDNAGPAAARNRGLASARGELVTFCDSDDVQLPHRIGAHVALLDRYPDAAVVAGELSIYEDERITETWGLRKIWIGPISRGFDGELEAAFPAWKTCRELGLPVPDEHRDRRVYAGRVAPLIALMHLAWGNAAMFRRAALDEVGGFDETIRYYEDWHLVGRISKRHALVFLDVPVMLYRRHPGQMTQRPGAAEGYLRVVRDVWQSDPEFRDVHAELIARAAGSALYQAGALCASRHDMAGAERRYLASIRENPRQKRVYLELLKVALKRRSTRWLQG